MKLRDFLIERKTNGLYAAVYFSDDTINRISKYCKKAKIPNTLDTNDFHSTLAYSRKPLNNFVPIEKLNETGIPIGFEVWASEPNAFKDDKTHCLVLHYESDYMRKRFDEILDLGATYDFDEYNPHISFSYDVGASFDIESLPPVDELGLLNIIGEYSEPLDL